MSFLTKRPSRGVTVAGAVVLAAGILIGYAGGGIAGDGMPADKTAVGGSAIEDIGPNAEHEILSQRMKVSSPADLILGVTAECTILTRLVTSTSGTAAKTEGSVTLRIEIDGKDVPVQTVGFVGDTDGDNDVDEDDNDFDDGRVTFCNRTYQRTETDNETDGVDKEDDYIRTKAANAFNWVALNVGVDVTDGGYDDPANGNNIVDIQVFARYDDSSPVAAPACTAEGATTTCSEAYVGKRTLVIEPVHAAVLEQSEPSNTTTTAAPVNIGL